MRRATVIYLCVIAFLVAVNLYAPFAPYNHATDDNGYAAGLAVYDSHGRCVNWCKSPAEIESIGVGFLQTMSVLTAVMLTVAWWGSQPHQKEGIAQ